MPVQQKQDSFIMSLVVKNIDKTQRKDFRCLLPLSTNGSKGEPCFWAFGQFLFDKNTARL
jgi:hypothetical protein